MLGGLQLQRGQIHDLAALPRLRGYADQAGAAAVAVVGTMQHDLIRRGREG